jgi:Zn-finger nucleic acid-binding protein
MTAKQLVLSLRFRVACDVCPECVGCWKCNSTGLIHVDLQTYISMNHRRYQRNELAPDSTAGSDPESVIDGEKRMLNRRENLQK